MKDDSHPWRRFFDGKGLIVTVAIIIVAVGLTIALTMKSKATGF